MNTLAILYYLIPLLGIILFVIGAVTTRVVYLISALWLGLIGLLIQYQAAGGEILGNYFDYAHTTVYSINLLILLLSLLLILIKFPLFKRKSAQYIVVIFYIFVCIASILLEINVWMNAYFIENRMANTPIMQVSSIVPLTSCNYAYVFYKIGQDGKISYLCPNHYGFIPAIGHMNTSPDFMLNHLIQRMGVKK